MKIVFKKIADLITPDYNPRDLTEAQAEEIYQSIKNYGFVEPVVVNINPERFNVIVGGNQRTRVARERLGMTEVPCVEVNLTLEQEKELNIRLNHASGEWNFDLLSTHFDEADLIKWGFTQKELGVDVIPQTTGDDKQPSEQAEKLEGVSAPGDHYLVQTENFQIILACVDVGDIDKVKSVMGERQCDCAVIDAPWGLQKKQAQSLLNSDSFEKLCSDVVAVHHAVLRPGACVYSFFPMRDAGVFCTLMADGGFQWSSTVIWGKQALEVSGKDYHPQYESIWYGWKDGQAHHRPEMCEQSDLWRLEGTAGMDENAQQRPVEIITRMLNTSTAAGDTVVDLFMGTGSTLIACAKMNRNGIGMDNDAKKVDAALQRLVNFLDENAIPFEVERNGEPFEIAAQSG